MLTDTQLAEWEALANAAAIGPWVPCHHWSSDHCGCGRHPGYIWDGTKNRVVAQMGCQEDEGGQAYPEPDENTLRASARFIAASRTALPELVAEVRRLRDQQARALEAEALLCEARRRVDALVAEFGDEEDRDLLVRIDVHLARYTPDGRT